MTKPRSFSRYAEDAVKLLGQQIKLERKRRKWSEAMMAERTGVSRTTLQKIEAGEMTCAIGLVFEAAALLGICLFESDKVPLKVRIDHTQETLALLPKRIKQSKKVIDDDF
tara:strand:+ start:1297 stop:1629 length:333 start_codon:yes stop_codon:yes gene_type:complete